jgi:predicted RNase H-like HicB family nuclease
MNILIEPNSPNLRLGFKGILCYIIIEILMKGQDGAKCSDQRRRRWLVVECPPIPGYISQGNTREDALDNIKEAIEDCLEVMEENIKAIKGKQVMEVVV